MFNRWKPSIKSFLGCITILIFVFFGILNVSFAQNSEKELFLVAQKAFEDGFYDVAVRYINQLLETYPQTDKRIQAQLILGQCYFFKNQYLKAYDTFNNLLDYPEYKDATLFWLGETYLKGSDYKQAENKYQELIGVFPDSLYAPQAYYSLGWIHFEQDKFSESRAILKKLIRKYPLHQLTEDALFKLGEIEYNLKSYDKTIEEFNKYILSYPSSRRHSEAYFYIAESYYYLDDPLTASTYYAQAAETSYDKKLVLMSKISQGWCYLKLEKLDLSKKYFDEAQEYSEERGILSDDVLLGQASLHSAKEEHKKALGFYESLIISFPNSSRVQEALLGKANAHYILEQYIKAIDTYEQVIEKFSDALQNSEIIEKAYFGLAWSLLKNGDIDASIKTFQTIKDKSENTTVKISALTQIGDAYQDANKLENAIEIYDKILLEYPDSLYTDYVQYRQGIALLKMNKIETATLSFQSLQANFPNSNYLHDIKYYLAVAYFKKGDWKVAKDQIKEFINSITSHSVFLAEARYILALSHFNLEQYKEAYKVFQNIIKKHPEQLTMIKKSGIYIAKCLYKIGNIKESLKSFNLIIQKYPQTEAAQESLIWIADHFLESSDYDNAIIYYTQFIEAFPSSDKLDMIFYELGQAHYAKEEYDKAINALQKISSDNKDDLFAKSKLIIAEIFSKELDASSAISTYENIIKSSPGYKRDAYLKLADISKNTEDTQGVIDYYKKALDADQGQSKVSNAEIQFYIADKYEFMNQKKMAIDEYLKIPYLFSEEIPWIVKAYLRIARIFEDEENWEEARLTYQKIIKFETVESKFAQERLEWLKNNTFSNFSDQK